MATTKTLTPTNQAITLAAFTEKPDNRTNVTNDDKMADAINTLNSNLNMQKMEIGTISGANISEFALNLVTKLKTLYTLSSLPIGTIISGEVVWTATGYFHFTVTLCHESLLQINAYTGARCIIAQVNHNTNTVVTVNELASNSNITPIELNGITAGTRTTIGDSHCYMIGKMVVVNISVVTQAAMTDSEVMVNGFPHPTKAVPITGHGNTGLGNYQGWLSTGGKIMNNYDGFQSGKRYYFNFAYIAKD